MILGVNGIRLLGMRTGVGRATEAILREMDHLEHPFREIRVYTPAPMDESVILPSRARNIVLPSPLPLGLWEQLMLPKAHGSRDLLFCPSYVCPLLARCPILLIHHGSYEGYPQAFPWWPRTKARWINQLSARRATRVCTVSQHSKRDIIRFYRVPAEKIDVIPNGVDTTSFRPLRDENLLADWRRKTLGQDVPFLLYVGKLAKRRNLPNLIEAFARLKRVHALPHKLLLIGTRLPGSPFEDTIRREALTDHVVCLGYATHDEILVAYNACEMLIYPSSYEGFGMPVLEAMACGTPVIAMNNTAFPEFAGGIAHLLDDAHVETLKSAIYELHRNVQRRERMAHEGPKRAAKHDWRRVTAAYLDVMKTLVAAV